MNGSHHDAVGHEPARDATTVETAGRRGSVTATVAAAALAHAALVAVLFPAAVGVAAVAAAVGAGVVAA